MQIPLQITIRDIPNSPAIEAKIQEKTNKLQRYHDRITSCRVVVELSQKHKHQGKLFNVRIDLTVPGHEIVVNKVEDEDLYVAIRDAFRAARRQLEEHIRRQRGDIKTHQETLRGRVVRLFNEEGYGFIAARDGREFYFHATNVSTPEFEDLKIGHEVEFLEIMGGEGLQAARVTIIEI